MFGEFEPAAKKPQNCVKDCTNKYQLQARHYIHHSGFAALYEVYLIEDEIIITSMKRYFQIVDNFYNYKGNVFAGVSFRDNKGHTVKSNKQNYRSSILLTTSPSLVCGTDRETSSEWIAIGGPIKGAYLVKNDEDDYYDYISDFGFYVEDPCQASDNKLNINLDP